jgi:hypothetical protein
MRCWARVRSHRLCHLGAVPAENSAQVERQQKSEARRRKIRGMNCADDGIRGRNHHHWLEKAKRSGCIVVPHCSSLANKQQDDFALKILSLSLTQLHIFRETN